eukprot:TRINITY_DN1158_c2_g3_i1.p1 TRINITY_DN1158_c2_g3~~TRINITY_DN1158_c2_g3_i1.p1  ORF type:complete len:104 (+),score=21.33 TRINITY_DN1158_c2_g3_i1:66-377(+)
MRYMIFPWDSQPQTCCVLPASHGVQPQPQDLLQQNDLQLPPRGITFGEFRRNLKFYFNKMTSSSPPPVIAPKLVVVSNCQQRGCSCVLRSSGGGAAAAVQSAA